MFRVSGGKSGVRFKDLSLYSRTTGPNCFPREDFPQIETENTAAIELNTGSTGHITDVIIENVFITNFTHGLRAISDPATASEISDIKIRAYRPVSNHRQLYIDAKYAYNSDVQNLNINFMMETQGGVEIVNAGKPASPAGENTKLKFLQVNCNANRPHRPLSVCRSKSTEVYTSRNCTTKALTRRSSSRTLVAGLRITPIPIRSFLKAVGTGLFYDASMKLYLIGNVVFAAPEIAQAGLDSGRLRFIGAGVNSTVIDCGELSSATCDSSCNAATKLTQLLGLGGTVYIKDSFTLSQTVTVPRGSQIVGASPEVTLTLNGNNTNLFRIDATYPDRTSGIVIRDLKLKTTPGSDNTGIAIVGAATGGGVSSDFHFSGLTIEGFEYGFYVRPASVDPMGPHPMVDGLSLKNESDNDLRFC